MTSHSAIRASAAQLSPQISGSAPNWPHTAGRSGRPNSPQRWFSSRCRQRTPGLPAGMPGSERKSICAMQQRRSRLYIAWKDLARKLAEERPGQPSGTGAKNTDRPAAAARRISGAFPPRDARCEAATARGCRQRTARPWPTRSQPAIDPARLAQVEGLRRRRVAEEALPAELQ